MSKTTIGKMNTYVAVKHPENSALNFNAWAYREDVLESVPIGNTTSRQSITRFTMYRNDALTTTYCVMIGDKEFTINSIEKDDVFMYLRTTL